jgi:hypothetical protein
VTDRSDLLGLLLSAEIVAALDEHVRDVVRETVRDEIDRQDGRQWIPVPEAAKVYGCSPAALRMRVKRGTVEARRQGSRLFVRADPGRAGTREGPDLE